MVKATKPDAEVAAILQALGIRLSNSVLSVTYQACTDTECLAPVTVELDIAIDAA